MGAEFRKQHLMAMGEQDLLASVDIYATAVSSMTWRSSCCVCGLCS